VWVTVQSRPEPKLAILAVGKRDISFDLSLPVPIARAARGSLVPAAVPPGWKITALNDQHAYLRWDDAEEPQAPAVGERVGLGISHPCTTFDKWHWMPVVEEDYRISDAVAMHF
jgi:D-serine dehydratase